MFRELLTCLGEVDELRQTGKVQHLLEDVLAITICAVLTHAESSEDIELYGRHKEKWLRQFLALPNGIPVAACRQRVCHAKRDNAGAKGLWPRNRVRPRR